jgi:hypothetical protein
MRRRRSCETRLAVRFATQPSANSSRAFAMSSLSESTATPTAETVSGTAPTQSSTMSMSWIMRSNTTSMSSERGWNSARRWASMNLGRESLGPRGDPRGVEALDVSDLERDAGARGRRAHRIGLLERGGHRLLHQHVAPRRDGDLDRGTMGDGRRGDGDRLACLEQGLGARERARAVTLRDLGGARSFAVVDADQLGAGQRVVHARVLLAPCAHSPHADADRFHRAPR